MSGRVIVVVAMCMAASAAAAQTSYKFKVTPGAGGNPLRYWDINDTGQIVAETTPASANPTCALLDKNTSTAIADPNAGTTQCYSISNAQEVVGYYLPASNPNTAVGFIYKGGTYTDFLAAGSNAAQGGTQLDAISRSGKIIAGSYSDASGFSRIFTLKGGKQTDITVPNANYLVATGVNDHGAVTAQSFDANNNIVANYLISGGKVTPITYPGNTTLTTVHIINDSGVVVGAYTDAAGVRHAFTFDSAAGTYSPPIDAPKAVATTGLGIDKSGKICGGTTRSGGVAEGFVGTPIQAVPAK